MTHRTVARLIRAACLLLARAGRRLRRLAVPALIVLALVYLGWHAVHGRRGLLAWLEHERRVEVLVREREALRAERLALEHVVKRLRSESIDPDLLEEMARKRLGLVHQHDVIILEPTAEPEPETLSPPLRR